MATFKRINRWWGEHAWAILTIAVGLLAFFMATVWAINSDQNRSQSDRLALLEDTTSSLSSALDKQRNAAADHGAPVVVPDSKSIKEGVRDGAKGDTGAVGPSGPPGPSGTPGRQGKDGNGTQGSPGPSGPPGSPGASGIPGKDGTNGTNGANGSDGTPGAQGPEGPKGEQGEQGPRGEKGEKGDTGATGPAPSKWTFQFGGLTYTCTPDSPDSTAYNCTSEGPLPDSNGNGNDQNVMLRAQPIYSDRRWYTLKT